MRNTVLSGVIYLALFWFGILKANTAGTLPAKVNFTQNMGQVSDQFYKPRPDILFCGNANGMTYHLKKNGISYQLYKVEKWKETKEEELPPKYERKVAEQISIYRLDINWLHVNPNVIVVPLEKSESYNNYYLEACPMGVHNVRTYESVVYKNIYNGIDLKYYSKDGTLKYDYIVKPYSDYKKIKFEIEGSEKISINTKGELVIKTPFGEISEEAPIVYQKDKRIPGYWKLNENKIQFDVPDYDPAYELIIDPIVRNWGTYYGGSGSEFLESSYLKGNEIYVAGSSDSPSTLLIATTGAHQTTLNGAGDAVLAKYNCAGKLIWGTYYGGSSPEAGRATTCDGNGRVYLAGFTQSTNSLVIATPGAHQTTYGGTWVIYGDCFLVQFNSNGVRQWGTYYGGSAEESAFGCAVDLNNNVYMTGQSHAATTTSLISTTGAHQVNSGGVFDAFLVKFNSSGVRQWGTFYGGSQGDYASYCTADKKGNIYVTGRTASTNNIATAGAHQTVFNGGTNDNFLVKFSSNGNRIWGTYYGGPGDEAYSSCEVDTVGNVYLNGNTTTTTGTFIATPSSHQPVFSGGISDGYIVKFDSNGVRMWGTYYGGTASEAVTHCATDNSGNLYFCGLSFSNNGISTPSGYQNVCPNTVDGSAFIAQFNSSGNLVYGSYYGDASGRTFGASCNVDNAGNMYLIGYTTATANIASPGSQQPTFMSSNWADDDGFLVKFGQPCLNPSPVTLNSTSTSICLGNSVTISIASGTLNCANNWQWYSGSCGGTAVGTGTSITVSPTTTTSYFVRGEGCFSPVNCDSIQIVVNPNPTVTANTSNSLICAGQTVTLTANGANTYMWSTSASGSTTVVSPTITTNYTVTGTDVNGCINATSITQSVSTCAFIKETENSLAFTIFPNPNSGEFTLSIPDIEDNLYMDTYNYLGQLISTNLIENRETQVSFKDQAAGIYHVRLRKDTLHIGSMRIIINR